jgi:hypothetical protein
MAAAPQPPPPGPERDRNLAGRTRYGPRYATPLGDVAKWVMEDAQMRERRRFQRVVTVLKAVLEPARLSRLKPVRCASGVLTIDVFDGPFLAELKQHLEPRLLDECARQGTGVSRIVWRLARGRRG